MNWSSNMVSTLHDKMKQLPKERQKKIKQRAKKLIAEEHSLRQLRKMMAKTQKDIAQTLHIGQESVSRIEKRSDILLSTLRKYVEAMGGELELVVHLPNKKTVTLNHFSDLD